MEDQRLELVRGAASIEDQNVSLSTNNADRTTTVELRNDTTAWFPANRANISFLFRHESREPLK